MTPLDLQVDEARVVRELTELADFSDAPAPAVTRVLFTAQDLAARRWLQERFAAEALSMREDPAGNLFARWQGTAPDLPCVGTGSHIDAIPHSGRYDGTVGVLGALEAIRALKRAGFEPHRSIELLMFTAEEPTRFGVGCIGSRLLSGAIECEAAQSLKDENEKTFEQIRLQAGLKGALQSVPLKGDYYRAFVELHIEQGPRLQQSNTEIGIVSAIAAPAAVRTIYRGTGGHAGATLMGERNDSLLAGAELALAVEHAALSLGGPDTVATTGVLDVHPRAINSIPSKVRLEIDLRDVEVERRDRVLKEIWEQVKRIGDKRMQQTTVELIHADPPATSDGQITSIIEQSCRQAGLTYERMISRAYHDSLFMALIAPMAMIFIPCRDGVSHRPDEYVTPQSIADGITTLGLTLANLSGSL